MQPPWQTLQGRRNFRPLNANNPQEVRSHLQSLRLTGIVANVVAHRIESPEVGTD